MGIEIKRKRSSEKIAGMEPPPNTVPALNMEWKQNKAFLEGNRKSAEQAQMNIRILQDQIDALILRLRELENVNEVLPDEFDDSNIRATLKDLQDQIDAIGLPPEDEEAAGAGLIAAKVSSDNTITVDLYANGLGQPATSVGVSLSSVLNLAPGQGLALDTEVGVFTAGAEKIGITNGIF